MLIDHISIQVRDLDAATEFYDHVLHAVGAKQLVDMRPDTVGYGRPTSDPAPQFWLVPLRPGTDPRGMHIAFSAQNREQVREFYQAAVANGATPGIEPQEIPEYGPGYYGAFVLDLDGNNVEACLMGPDA